jgi:pimeloyl-ACP methyl ester carboxylesterase
VFEAGACCSGSVWEAAGALLEATGARVLRYDRAGFGGSEADLRDERGVGEAGKDLVAAVRNSGARPPYVLVAHSLGALFVDAALRDGGLPRDDVLGVVYVDPASLDGVRGLRRFVPKRSPPRWAARLLGGLGVLRLAMPRVLAVYYDAFGGAGPRVRGEAVENWARGDWLVSYTREWAAALAFAGEGAAAGEALPVRRAARHAEAADGGAYGPGWLGDLPIAVIVPDVYERTRGMQYVGDIQRRVARYSTDAELFEPADCGHFVQIEQPEQVAAAVRSVVRRARVRRARAGALERRRPGSAAGGRGAAVDGDADGGGSARP